MIDLRSDTLTKPTAEIRKAMYNAEVGDAGRMDAGGKGEDPTVNRLEDIAAQLTGKEAAMFVPSGTMGNLAALMTYIVRLDVSPSGQDAKTFQQLLESKGLKVKAVSEKFIRMVTYREIGKEDILQASHIINESCRAI